MSAPVDRSSSHEATSGRRVLDVREQHEWDAGHVEGSLHIPLRELPARMAEVDRTTPVVVVCAAGQRSAYAAGLLQAQGYDASNLEGGLEKWAVDGFPLVTSEGKPGRVVH